MKRINGCRNISRAYINSGIKRTTGRCRNVRLPYREKIRRLRHNSSQEKPSDLAAYAAHLVSANRTANCAANSRLIARLRASNRIEKAAESRFLSLHRG